ncbi:MAG: large conductance mechanosensitive channel protein MscL [Thermoleophilia bacterium]|nr:large conductance mechanosensitive channel protein MscL [Thermoleophilia bacterium]
MFREFRSFLLRGNVIDLAVGVIAGAAFGLVVKSLVDDIILQLITAVFGKPDFSELAFMLNGSAIRYGNFLTALVIFVLTMAGVFFLIVKPINTVTEKLVPLDTDGASTQRECPECLTEVPSAATRCRACTAVIVPVVA